MEIALAVLLGVVAIALAAAIAPKVNIAGPLILVVLGIGVGLLPFVPSLEIDPEWILVGVLPPLLYAAAVRLPAIEFRRDFGPIAGLAFLLVLITSAALAALFVWAIPGLDPVLAIAIGAILSPTDAVATAIARRAGISRRVIVMLEGESLLNDATALVLLRAAVAAVVAATATGSADGGEFATGFLPDFAWGVIVALAVGAAVGYLNLRLRALIPHSAATTALGFVVPYAAYLPTEHLGGSGLVAAVVAGIITGQGATRWFSPDQRRSDELNWRTVELILEGAVFLVMGLEIKEIVEGNFAARNGLGFGLALAAASLVIVVAIRAVYVTPLIWLQSRRARDRQRRRLDALSEQLDDAADRMGDAAALPGDLHRRRATRRLSIMRTRVTRAEHDLDYYQDSALGWKHGAVIVWAGMRGVVTLAAAQTLPSDTTERALLVFVAFAVAIGSLIIQGLTLPWVVRLLQFPRSESDGASRAELDRLDDDLRDAAVAALASPALARRDGSPFPADLTERIGTRLVEPPDEDRSDTTRAMLELRLVLIEAMRRRLATLSSGGSFSTAALRRALAELDADQLSIELRLAGDE